MVFCLSAGERRWYEAADEENGGERHLYTVNDQTSGDVVRLDPRCVTCDLRYSAHYQNCTHFTAYLASANPLSGKRFVASFPSLLRAYFSPLSFPPAAPKNKIPRFVSCNGFIVFVINPPKSTIRGLRTYTFNVENPVFREVPLSTFVP